MTVKEFEKQNSDILLQRITDADFQELTDGMVFFCITTTVGSKPVNDGILFVNPVKLRSCNEIRIIIKDNKLTI